jgi:molybdopterin/thiamine biosynthesis adenylyltransferase
MSPEQATFKSAIEAALTRLGALNLRFTESVRQPRWDFELPHKDQAWPLYLQTPYWSLAPLPYLHWAVPEPVWGWPHTGDDGSICAFDRQGLDYDTECHEGILRSLIDKSMEMLIRHHKMSESDRMKLFADELDAYARKIGVQAHALNRSLGKAHRVPVDVRSQNKGKWEVHRINSPETNTFMHRQSLFVLDINIVDLPPLVKNPDNEWWKQLCARLPKTTSCRLQKKRGCGVILRVANRYDGALLLLYWGNRNRAQERQVFRLEAAYRDYLNRRVGQPNLEHRTAVIGVGAVGSRVAEHLALAGIKQLTLVDPDELSANNLGRHVLTSDFLSINKAQGLANHLIRRIPGLDVKFCETSMLGWLETAQPNDFEVIVLATGDSAAERQFLKRAWREGWTCRLVCVFVEAANLGGHAIAMQPREPGCLECLYEREDPKSPALLRTSMLIQGQVTSQEISGCGAFTPYSAITATRTAIAAVELALTTDEIGYKRWAGNDKDAMNLNLKPSDFWLSLRTGRVATFITRNSYIKKGCPCCSN